MPRAQIVVIDDERHIGGIIREALACDEYEVTVFTDPREALKHISDNRVDLVLTDLVMGDYSGVQVLDQTLRCHRDAVVVLMTAHPTVQTAIAVLKKGGYDFLVKPFKLEILKATIERGLAHQKVLRENLKLKGQVEFLKVANASGAERDIDDYLDRVLESCRTELGAVAAGIVEIDPGSRRIVRRLASSGDADFAEEILDHERLAGYTAIRGSEPVVETSRTKIDGKDMSRVFVAKPILIRGKLHGLITLLIIDRFDYISPGQFDALTILTNSAASALANFRLYRDVQRSYLEAISALAHAIEARDECTKGHTDRVVKLAQLVASELAWDGPRMNNLVMGCTLHDVGKLGVPDSILNKPAELTDDEQERMRTHPEVGLRIVAGIDLFKPAIPYIIAHHERFDGDGYPSGLHGEDIPVEGRLLAVVDTLDAILSDRPYRTGAKLRTALEELWVNRGTQFDPHIVDVLFDLIRAGKVDFKELYGRDEDLKCIDDIVSRTETVRA